MGKFPRFSENFSTTAHRTIKRRELEIKHFYLSDMVQTLKIIDFIYVFFRIKFDSLNFKSRLWQYFNN
jgi:hypothetical protein